MTKRLIFWRGFLGACVTAAVLAVMPLARASGPVITAVGGPPNGTYNLQEHDGAYVVVTFSSSIFLTGGNTASGVTISVQVGSTPTYFSGASVAGNQLYFFFEPANVRGPLTITGPINLNGASIKDSSGNDAVLSFTPVSLPGVIIDKLSPAAPIIGGMTPASPTADQPLTLYGTAEPLGTLSYQVDRGTYNYAPVDANGHWSVTVGPLAAGNHAFTADFSDQWGNWAGYPGGPPTGLTITVQAAGIPQQAPGPLPAHLINLSARAYANNGAQALTAGFIVAGDSASTKPVLMRGVGPTLSQFGVTAPVAKAALNLFRSGGQLVATDDGWGTDSLLSSTAAQVSAFALPANSGDSAIVWSLYPGAYTIQVSDDTGAGGNALAEVYDVAGSDLKTRLINISARASIGAAAGGGLTCGFVVSGSGSETVLIRGIGPALAQFGVPAPASAPQLTLFDHNSQILTQNAGWPATAVVNGSTLSLAGVFTQVGAFPLPAGSADCAILVTLPAGAYTAQLVEAPGSSGDIGLVEVYEVSSQ